MLIEKQLGNHFVFLLLLIRRDKEIQDGFWSKLSTRMDSIQLEVDYDMIHDG